MSSTDFQTGERVRHSSSGRSGVVSGTTYPDFASGVRRVPVRWDDNGKEDHPEEYTLKRVSEYVA